MEEAYRTIRKQVVFEILDAIETRQRAMTTLLNNGRPIIEMAYGRRFEKLYKQRCKLFDKLDDLGRVWNMIYDMK